MLLQGVATKQTQCCNLCFSIATAGLALKYKMKIKLLPSPIKIPYSKLKKTQDSNVIKNGIKSIPAMYVN